MGNNFAECASMKQTIVNRVKQFQEFASTAYIETVLAAKIGL